MQDRWEPLGFWPGEMYLPNNTVQMEKWAVIACDQYTGKRAYWEKVAQFVGSSPSTLHMILPEIYLGKGEKNISLIQQKMEEYLEKHTLIPYIKNGFVLVERSLETGKRLGLIGMIDLEQYNYEADSISLIRPTEGTITQRIPPRLTIREKACMEFSHVILLIDDPENLLFSAIHQVREKTPDVYDFELMGKGGHIKGWSIDNESGKNALYNSLKALLDKEKTDSSMLFAVGDGNHSLATAKTHWEKLKERLTTEEQKNHPARYAMVEVQNIYDPAILIEPIHRILYGWDEGEMKKAWSDFTLTRGIKQSSVKTKQALAVEGSLGTSYWEKSEENTIFVQYVQAFLDMWTQKNPNIQVDYIHGDQEVSTLVAEQKGIGIILPPIAKESVLPFVQKNGPYPRKSFSVGHADEKRFYLEGRKIK